MASVPKRGRVDNKDAAGVVRSNPTVLECVTVREELRGAGGRVLRKPTERRASDGERTNHEGGLGPFRRRPGRLRVRFCANRVSPCT
jgi:hypothetical protein